MKTKHHGQMSESFLTAVFLSLSGGLQDAYTYLFRGKVFANAQTGNIVLLSSNIMDGQWDRVCRDSPADGVCPAFSFNHASYPIPRRI